MYKIWLSVLYSAPPVRFAPGKSFWIASQNGFPPICRSSNAGHVKFNNGAATALLINSRGAARVLYRPESALGLANFSTSKTKQSRLFFSKRVVRLRTPPVRSDRSTPAKLLTLPVFPPMLWNGQIYYYHW